MSATGTRPPLFDPEPGGFDDEQQPPRQQFPRQRSGRKGKQRSRRSGSDSSSPKWVRPFILGGLVLIAVISLASIFTGGSPAPAPATDDDAAGPEPVQDEPDAQAVTASDPAAADDADDVTTPADQATQAGEMPPPGGAPAPATPTDPSLQAATAFAVQFAHDYLNYDEARPQTRERDLRAYLAPDLDPQLGWDGQGVQIAVLTVPVATDVDEDTVIVTVAAQVTGQDAPRWVHLAVPLAQDQRGRWAVVARPAYVPRPSPGTPEVDEGFEIDQELSARLAPAMTQLFQAYAVDAAVDVAGITAPEATIRGLAGQVAFSGVDTVRIRTGDDEIREGLVTVTWDDSVTGGSTSQRYRIQLVASDDGWLVEAVEIGLRNPSA